jgi:O-methyltransferase domain/Dimerisation domain
VAILCRELDRRHGRNVQMIGSGAPGATISPQQHVIRLMDGYLTTQLLYVAAKLGIADLLAAAPLSGSEIAAAVGADPEALTRTLRGLVIEDVLSEEVDGRFALTTLGTCLRRDVPGSMRASVIVRGALYFRAAEQLLRTVTEGGTAFEHAFGEEFFAHLAGAPELELEFNDSMASRAGQEAGHVVGAYDFSGFRRIVDVGGGQGLLTATVLRHHPALRGVLVDLPAAVDRARERLQLAGVSERCDCVAGDFFESVPLGADAYLLSRVIHDWPDADAVRILTTVRTAMSAGSGGSRLLLVEAILPERAADAPAVIRMDLHMLILAGARERTANQYRKLLADAGFRVERIVPTESPVSLSVIEAVKAE